MRLTLANHRVIGWAVTDDVYRILALHTMEGEDDDVIVQGGEIHRMHLWIYTLAGRYDLEIGEDIDSHSMECECYWCRDAFVVYQDVTLITVAPDRLVFETKTGAMVTISS